MDDSLIFFVLATTLAFSLVQVIQRLCAVQPFFHGVCSAFLFCDAGPESFDLSLLFFYVFCLFFIRCNFFLGCLRAEDSFLRVPIKFFWSSGYLFLNLSTLSESDNSRCFSPSILTDSSWTFSFSYSYSRKTFALSLEVFSRSSDSFSKSFNRFEIVAFASSAFFNSIC